MPIKIEFTLPSGSVGFVEDKRAFCVQGNIISKQTIPNNALLRIELINSKKEIVRYIESDKKNKEIIPYFEGLTTYSEQLDKGRKKMIEFGFPELIVDQNTGSINNATLKCWYNDNCFKGIFINASDVKHGAIFDDGIGFVDENGRPYSLLDIGTYTIKATLSFDGEILASESKKIKIGKHKEQIICRFNPISHKQRMIKWCKENDYNIIEDLMPGYLEPYLGKWYYHMGLLPMYRANDICMYESAKIRMFVYLIDKTSTSYETELAYLQANNALSDSKRFKFYHYDIGEAIVGKNRNYERKAKILEFKENEDIYLCRIDILNKKIEDNKYYLDERDVKNVIFDIDNVKLNNDSDIAIMGVVKPSQLNPDDFILRKDNTYEINNYPSTIRYTLYVDDDKLIIDKKLNMERFEDESIGTSVYEFYNTLHIEKELKGMEVKVIVECIDAKGNVLGNFKKFGLKVK